ncbi:hypothetical protein BTXL6_11205 [Bacillus thuringiensis]|nr:hypothetical protein BTXL6_28770 [Bacillus thuringiensis]ALL21973.1 hypothetical protein BTXL6_11205 [Bacillus thuringiensis]
MKQKRNAMKNKINAQSSPWFPANHKNKVEILQKGMNGVFDKKLGLNISPFPKVLTTCMQIVLKSIQFKSTLDIQIKEIFNCLWPMNADSQFIWQLCIAHLESLIQFDMPKSLKHNIFKRLQNIENEMKVYEKSFDEWQRTSNENVKKQELKKIIFNIESFLEECIRFFAMEKYELLLLVIYAQIANLHLLILRISLIYGEELDLTQEEQSVYQNKLISKIKLYTNYCTHQYKRGLFRIKKMQDYSCNSIEKWNLFNAYQKDMTLMVLDIISIWPTYDYSRYPMKTKIELTREIWTDIQYVSIENDKANLNKEVDFTLCTEPQIFEWLSTLEFYMRNSSNTSEFMGNIVGIHYSSYKTHHRKQHISRWWGEKSKYDYKLTVQNLQEYPVYNSIAQNSYESNQKVIKYIEKESQLLYHRLSRISGVIECPDKTNVSAITFAWAHVSVQETHDIDNKKLIIQIPASKAWSDETGKLRVIDGISTGGPLVLLEDTPLTISLNSKILHHLRIRYACNNNGVLRISKKPKLGSLSECIAEQAYKTTYEGSERDLVFESFDYLDFDFLLGETTSPYLIILERIQGTSPLIIDKIECIPVCITKRQHENNQYIKEAQKAVNQLFTNSLKNKLKFETTDYNVDQTAKKVESIYDSISLKEKVSLLRDVKHAKRLSKYRNLISNEDFGLPELISKNSWQFTHHVRVSCSDPQFKGYFLEIPSVKNVSLNEKDLFRNVYQKIDESKLKPYTRYIVRGFIGHCEDLEIWVTRYEKEVMSLQNVNNIVNNNGSVSHDTSHYFKVHIDVGNLDIEENLGIWVAFQITSPNGSATLGNIELIEMMPLSGKLLTQIKNTEEEWKKEKERRQLESNKSIQIANKAVKGLFDSSQEKKLNIVTSKKDILDALEKVENITYVYHSYLHNVVGNNFNVYKQLQERINRAFDLYQSRNKIMNGDFSRKDLGWNITPGIEFLKEEYRYFSLFIKHWSSSAVQEIELKSTCEYLLRVTGTKKAAGTGYVVCSGCASEYIQALFFTASEGERITKTIEVFPKTNRVQIEISTTNGTFLVESIELICLEDEKID